jgi:hypothetical protein
MGAGLMEYRMLYRRVGITFLAAAALMTADCAVAAEPRAVIELFTSQGCSSCPAADKLLGELKKDPSLITMSLAVDYWDYLGWKDTLALHGHSNRQRAYAGARGDRQVYTPQVVVNGVVHVLGSDKAAIDKAIAETRRTATPLSLAVKMTVAGDRLTVDVPAAKDERNRGEVWLCPISREVQVAIGRGENHGRTITYHNVVRRWVKLGEWTGKAESFSVPVADVATKDIDSFAVVVQSGVAASPGVMLGAAVAALR